MLPLPAWDLVDVERYRAFWRKRHGYFSLNVVTTRGCPYKCNWCAKPVYGNTYHSRSPENVVAELRLLRERYAPDHLWFCDDILGLKARWLLPWSEAVEKAGVRTPFLCQTRADLMTEENVRALHRAGAAEVWLGAESGSQRVLDDMEKGISVQQTREAVGRLRAQGVRVGLFLQFGYGGEDWSEVQKTRALVRELLPDDIGILGELSAPRHRLLRDDEGSTRRKAQLEPEQRPRPAGAESLLAALLPDALSHGAFGAATSTGSARARHDRARSAVGGHGALSPSCTIAPRWTLARRSHATRGRTAKVTLTAAAAVGMFSHAAQRGAQDGKSAFRRSSLACSRDPRGRLADGGMQQRQLVGERRGSRDRWLIEGRSRGGVPERAGRACSAICTRGQLAQPHTICGGSRQIAFSRGSERSSVKR